MSRNRVLISILNWNKSNETLACLNSLIHELNVTAAEVTVLIIDNGSKSEDLAHLVSGTQSHPVVVIKLPFNIGFTGGHNVAIRIGIDEGYDFIWLLNNDSVVIPGALALLLSAMEADDRCGAVSPVILNNDDEKLVAACLRIHDWRRRLSIQAGSVEEAKKIQHDQPKSVWLVGTAILLRIQAVQQIGFLDDRLFAYFDDDDLGVRLSKAGWSSKCVFEAAVAHDAKRHPEQFPLYYYYLMQRNEMLFWQKHTPSGYRNLLWVKLLDAAFHNVNRLYRRGLHAQGDAALLGAFDFVLSRFGAPHIARKVPFPLRVLCKFYSAYSGRKSILRWT